MVHKGAELLFTLVKILESKAKISDMLVIAEFLDVFPDDLPRAPLPQEIDFSIELVLDATLISHSSYQMALKELADLKVQL